MTEQDEIYFFHGLESGPVGTKSTHLEEFFEVNAPDFRDMDIWERLEKAERITAGADDLVVVGSSYGGLLAALLYSKHPERFRGYVLMAPALARQAADNIERMPENAVVIHGVDDEVVPIEAVRDVCAGYGLQIDAVDDDHRLHDSLDRMVQAVEDVLRG